MIQERITQEEMDALFQAGITVGRMRKQHDAYRWRAIYHDGTATDEYDDARPDGRGWAEREGKPVQSVTLIRAEDGTEAESMPIPHNATPVFFRRRRVAINPNGSSAEDQGTIHCIGWKQGEQATYLFVYDDGTTLRTDDLQAV